MNTSVKDLINGLYTIDLTNSSQAVKQLYLYLQEMFKDFEFEGDLDQLTELLVNHITNLNNPHQVTPTQLNIDESLVGITATQIVATVTALATQNQTDIVNHTSNLNNPHEVTYHQVGFMEVTVTDPTDPTGQTTKLGLEVTLSDGSVLSLVTIGDSLTVINQTLTSLQTQITNNNANLQEQITQNTTDIATNTTNITTNTNDIASINATISENTTNIANNLTLINTINKTIFNANGTTYNLDPTLQNITALDLPVSTATQNSLNTLQNNINNHIVNTNNPHNVTPSQLNIDSSLVGVTADELPTTSVVQTQLDSILSTQTTHTSQIGTNTSNIQTNLSYIQQLQALVAALENVITQFPMMGISEPYPTTNDVPNPNSQTFYLIGSAPPYDVYIYISSTWYKIGTFDGSSGQFATQVDLTNLRNELMALIQANANQIQNILNGGAQDPLLPQHIADHTNPHRVTASQVGLSNVNNTSDLDKPISNATQEALTNITDSISTHTSNTSNPHNVTKTQVGLGNVENVDTTNASNIASGVLSPPIYRGGLQSITIDNNTDFNTINAEGVYRVVITNLTNVLNSPFQSLRNTSTSMRGILIVTNGANNSTPGYTVTTNIHCTQTFIDNFRAGLSATRIKNEGGDTWGSWSSTNSSFLLDNVGSVNSNNFIPNGFFRLQPNTLTDYLPNTGLITANQIGGSNNVYHSFGTVKTHAIKSGNETIFNYVFHDRYSTANTDPTSIFGRSIASGGMQATAFIQTPSIPNAFSTNNNLTLAGWCYCEWLRSFEQTQLKMRRQGTTEEWLVLYNNTNISSIRFIGTHVRSVTITFNSVTLYCVVSIAGETVNIKIRSQNSTNVSDLLRNQTINNLPIPTPNVNNQTRLGVCRYDSSWTATPTTPTYSLLLASNANANGVSNIVISNSVANTNAVYADLEMSYQSTSASIYSYITSL